MQSPFKKKTKEIKQESVAIDPIPSETEESEETTETESPERTVTIEEIIKNHELRLQAVESFSFRHRSI